MPSLICTGIISLPLHTFGKQAIKNLLPLQPGDVLATYADIEDLSRDTGFKPNTSIEVGIPLFVEWYRSYYGC